MKEVGENNAEPAMPPDTIHPARVPDPPTPTPTLPGWRGLAYLDDAAAPGGSPRRLQEASLAVRRDPCSDWQYDPAATVPRPAPRGRRHAVSGGAVRAHSGVIFAPGCVGCWGTLPAGRALGHGWARFGLSGGRRQRSPAAGQRCAHAPGGGPARLCFTTRPWRRRRRRQLSGEKASLGERCPPALVQETRSPLGDGSGCGEESEQEWRGEKERRVSETGGKRPLCAKQKAPAAWPGGLRGRDAHRLSAAGAGRPWPAHPPPARSQRRSCPRKCGGGLHSALL